MVERATPYRRRRDYIRPRALLVLAELRKSDKLNTSADYDEIGRLLGCNVHIVAQHVCNLKRLGYITHLGDRHSLRFKIEERP